MRILYLGHGGDNQKDRVQEILHLGHDVVSETLYPKRSGFIDRAGFKAAVWLNAGPWITAVNKALLERARVWERYDMVWLDKAQYVSGNTIDELRHLVRCPVIQFTPDVALKIEGSQRSEVFVRAIPSYDAVVTTKDFEVNEYVRLGARQVVLTEKAVSHRRFYPRRDCRKEIELGFVGHRERHYGRMLRAIAAAGLPVMVRGPGWDGLSSRLDYRYRNLDRSGPVRGENYPRLVSSMRIGLGMLTKLAPEVITARSLELPACGTFLLAERTEKHQELFKEGEEAELFSSTSELLDKAKFYLRCADKREIIASRGLDRFLTSSHRLDRQISTLMATLSNQFGY